MFLAHFLMAKVAIIRFLTLVKNVFAYISIFRYERLKQSFAHCKYENAARTRIRGHQAEVENECYIFTRAVSESPVRPHVSNILYFSLQIHSEPEFPHRLQTPKMRCNSTSLNTCQHNVNIVTVHST